MTEPKIPEEVMDDWEAILQRPGMSVLATFLSGHLNQIRARLEDGSATKNWEQVCEARGEIRGIKRVIQYVKREYDRAAKSDTPGKEQ